MKMVYYFNIRRIIVNIATYIKEMFQTNKPLIKNNTF